MRKRFSLLVVFLLLLTLSLGATVARGQSGPDTSDARVDADVWEALQAHGRADVLILLNPQPDLSPARNIMDKTARGQWVYDTLRAAAIPAQAPLRAQLERMGLAYRPFWIVNAVQTTLSSAQIEQVLAQPHVRQIVLNKSFRVVEPFPAHPFAPDSVSTVEWGVNRVNAPWVWDQGVTGRNVVVAGQDTGYMWDHVALKYDYRGNNVHPGTPPNHNYNWHDSIHAIDPHNSGSNPCGLDSPEPCDDHGHGTHTMGTMLGNDLNQADPNWPEGAAHAIGIAPGAKWIGCRNMERGWGQPSTYIECFQWFAAPWPIGGDPATDGDPAKAPDVINNSWGCPSSEGCVGPEIEPAMNAAIDAGIVVVVSAGNSGSSCSSVGDPPAIYPRSFAVGATDSSDSLAYFSSRGPVTYNGQTFRKPDISGPGVGVTSSYYNGGYTTMQGTSMAGPHVAGVTALLLSAQPSLKGRVEMTEQILMRTADPKTTSDGCGGDSNSDVPNNSFGWGIVNARSAIESLSLPATLSGVVTDTFTGSYVAGATVALHPLGQPGTTISTTLTNAAGAYDFSGIDWGEYEISLSLAGYDDAQASPIYVVGGKTTQQDVGMNPQPQALTDLTITNAAPDILLSWTHQESLVDHYEVWRALDAPYFQPDGEGVKLGEVAAGALGASLVFTDTVSPLGDPNQQGSYLVLGVSAAGARATPQMHKGEFDFSLTPGD